MSTFDYNTFVSDNVSSIDENRIASNTWRLIQRNPVSIEIKRGKTASKISAQTVSLSFDNTERELPADNGTRGVSRDATLFGVRGHPLSESTVPNTDVKRGDLFEAYGRGWRVMDVILVPGGLQAKCEVIS